MHAEPEPSPEHYRILPVRLRDLPAVHRLERLVFARDAYSWPGILLLLIWPGLVNLKAVAPDGQMVGFISGGRLFDRRTWIITLGVHPDHQRRGLGRRLLAACESHLSAPTLFLTVREGNTPAIALYRQTGYRETRLKYGYYADGETGIEMRKDR